jgi:hypothetical protein
VGRNGDPQGDDYGLPHIDIVVPDDARELDREVVAYRREQRQRRRRDRWQRITTPFTRFGLAAPIIAAALLIAVASGTLLTVFGPNPAPRTTTAITQRPSPRAGQLGGPLPDAQVAVDGERSALIDRRPAVIIMVPPECDCDATVAGLTRQATRHRIGVYLAAGPAAESRESPRPGPAEPAERADPAELRGAELRGADLRGLAKRSAARVLEDDEGVLVSTYRPAGLTALLVHTDGVVGRVVPGPRADQSFERLLEPLQRPGAGVAATAPS